MSSLKAIISGFNLTSQLVSKFKDTTKLIQLNDFLYMIPLTNEAYDFINVDDEDEPVFIIKGSKWLTVKMFGVMMRFSALDKIAYIEIEDFDDTSSSQSAVVWENHKSIFEIYNQCGSINSALQILGVKKQNENDEFNTIGLGKYVG